ncbi:MFS transporter [Candidatus Hepatincolaceae symbiont of Richtersius coronifer]
MPLLFLIVLTDSIGFGIILPLLPIFALKYSLSPIQLGLLISAFAFFQLLTAPFLGALSDKYGRKIIIIVCLLFISASYKLLAEATTFYGALLARSLAGMFTGNISVVLASVADLSTSNKRAKYMGYIGAASGIGFMLGPIIGGFFGGPTVEGADVQLVFNIACVFTLVAAIMAAIFLKETLSLSVKSNKFDPVARIKRTLLLIFNDKYITFLIYLSVLMWFSFASLNVFLSTWSVMKFHLSPLSLGIIGTTFAFFAALVQIISPKHITGSKAILIGFLISSISTFALLFNPNMVSLVIILIFLAIGIGILFPNLNSTISLYGSESQRGFVLGISQSAGTLGQSLGPIIVGFIYANTSPNYGWLTIALSFSLAVIITVRFMWVEKQNALHKLNH